MEETVVEEAATAERVSESVEEASETDALTARISDLEGDLSSALQAVEASDMQRQIDVALLEAGTLDLETASMLVWGAIGTQSDTDVKRAVRELRSRKAHLFREVTAPNGARAPSHDGEADPLLEAAAEAASRGDRNSLLQYLRLRRCG
jgi:hypothetical protein